MNTPNFTIGETRYSSAGNIWQLIRATGNGCYVKRIGIVGQVDPELWDRDILYRWHVCQWEELPLVGQTSDSPFFGRFIPC